MSQNLIRTAVHILEIMISSVKIENWPPGKKIAVSVNIMCEAWTPDTAPGLGPMGNPLKSGFLDTQARSWAKYGMTTGVYRLLDIVAEEQIPCGTYASGIIAEDWPEVLQRMDKDNHFIGAHSWAQNVLPIYQTAVEEETDIVRGIEAFNSCIGKSPEGFISPRGTPSKNTPELLTKHGFRWHSDYFDQDLPYKVENKFGTIAAVPFTMEVNDLPIYMRYGNEPEAYTNILNHIVNGVDQNNFSPFVLDITVHAHVFGRPFGAIEFQKAIRRVRDIEWIWMTDHSQLADLVL